MKPGPHPALVQHGHWCPGCGAKYSHVTDEVCAEPVDALCWACEPDAA